jgi:hypothetical protein
LTQQKVRRFTRFDDPLEARTPVSPTSLIQARARAMVPPSIVVALQVESTFEVGHRQLKGLGWGETVGQGPPNENGCPTVVAKSCTTLDQWKFQDPKMEGLYHIRPYYVGISPYISLI